MTTEAVEETTEAVEETTAAVEETTVAEETQPTTEPAPAASLVVKATSNLFPETVNAYDDLSAYEDGNGDVFVTVEYKLAAPGQYLINLDVEELSWDPAVLEFKEAYNTLGSGRQAKFTIFPFAFEQGLGAGMVNTFGDNNGGRLVGNYTSVQPAAYATEEDNVSPVTVVRAVFKVLDREAGETTVNLLMDTLSLCDDSVTEPYSQNVLVSGGVVNQDILDNCTVQTIIQPEGQVEPPVEETTTPEETTEAQEETTEAVEETTEAVEETTTPVEEDDTLIVAGSEPEIFGTSWDGTNTDNLMTKQGDGTYTKDYTVSKTYDAVQLKAVKNGSEWIGDKTDNNVTFNVTAPGTFTVTYHPAKGEEPAYVDVTGDNVEAITTFDYNTVYAVGNGEGTWLNGVAWEPNNDANEMSEVADGLWEISFDNVPDGFGRQIKFAIDGAWTHNFGGAFVESGVETDAVYNGDNITFDTDDVCTVKAQLDLRNFDFTTKEGAKFTITITYDEEVTTSPEEETTEAVEETTEAVEETTGAVEETTEAVEETTEAVEETTGAVEETSTPEDETTTPVEEGTTNPDETGTSSTDATSATRMSSTSDSPSTPDSSNGSGTGNNGGFVQTGNASMAIIILLVLVSATAGIWFARKKVK